MPYEKGYNLKRISIMKGFVKFFGFTTLVAVMGLVMTGCKINEADYEDLNGDWDRGDIVVTFTNNVGTFAKVESSSDWKPLLDAKAIHIGGQKFRNIVKKGDLAWTGQELTYTVGTTNTSWEDCTLTVSGKTLTVSSSAGTGTYTRQ
jgi:hypothetical protein